MQALRDYEFQNLFMHSADHDYKLENGNIYNEHDDIEDALTFFYKYRRPGDHIPLSNILVNPILKGDVDEVYSTIKDADMATNYIRQLGNGETTIMNIRKSKPDLDARLVGGKRKTRKSRTKKHSKKSKTKSKSKSTKSRKSRKPRRRR